MLISANSKTALQIINIVLFFAAGVLALIFVLTLAFNRTVIPTEHSMILDDKQAVFALNLPGRSVADYLGVVSNRILFRPAMVKKEKIRQTTIDDLTRDLMLVGVVSVGNKEAIIKDRRTRQSHFVNMGQRLGELVIVDVQDNKIKVAYKDEEKELFLQ